VFSRMFSSALLNCFAFLAVFSTKKHFVPFHSLPCTSWGFSNLKGAKATFISDFSSLPVCLTRSLPFCSFCRIRRKPWLLIILLALFMSLFLQLKHENFIFAHMGKVERDYLGGKSRIDSFLCEWCILFRFQITQQYSSSEDSIYL
jgi:hypothetical protein